MKAHSSTFLHLTHSINGLTFRQVFHEGFDNRYQSRCQHKMKKGQPEFTASNIMRAI